MPGTDSCIAANSTLFRSLRRRWESLSGRWESLSGLLLVRCQFRAAGHIPIKVVLKSHLAGFGLCGKCRRGHRGKHDARQNNTNKIVAHRCLHDACWHALYTVYSQMEQVQANRGPLNQLRSPLTSTITPKVDVAPNIAAHVRDVR